MTIDPDGCTFWYTNEYYANKPTTLIQDNWQTRIGSFKFGTCATAPAPSISGFSPASGPVGTSVTINGSNFTGTTSVAFNGASATFTVNSGGTQITASVPAAAKTGPISVTTSAGTATSKWQLHGADGGDTHRSAVERRGWRKRSASWSNVVGPTKTDWIGLYHPGDADTAYIDWIYDDSLHEDRRRRQLELGLVHVPDAEYQGTTTGFSSYQTTATASCETSGQVTVTVASPSLSVSPSGVSKAPPSP